MHLIKDWKKKVEEKGLIVVTFGKLARQTWLVAVECLSYDC